MHVWVTKHARSALECCDLSQIFRLGRLVARAAPRAAVRRVADGPRFAGRTPLANGSLWVVDGDKSPAESGDKSPHSKARRACDAGKWRVPSPATGDDGFADGVHWGKTSVITKSTALRLGP